MISLDQVRTIGGGLTRPEGVMAADDGTIYTADGHGRCSRIGRDGTISFFGSLGGLPNGICLDLEGNCIVANIGNGRVQSLKTDGSHSVLVSEAGGKPVSSPNFPFIDSRGRLWVTNSTAQVDVESALRKPVADGSIVVLEEGKPRVAAEGIYFANGVAIDPEERFIYVAETMQRRIIRFRIGQDGSLGPMEVYGPGSLGKLGYPDGIAFDEAENLWIAFPAWNAIGLIDRTGELQIMLQDPERQVLRSPANICFGWENRRTAFIGSLQGTNVPLFEVPFPGARLVHQSN